LPTYTWIGDSNLNLEAQNKKTSEIIIPNERKRYEDFLTHNNSEGLNVFKKGPRDASLKYLDMEEYFEILDVRQYGIINRRNIEKCLNKKILQEVFTSEIEKSNQLKDIDDLL
jgi:hypothetical protein